MNALFNTVKLRMPEIQKYLEQGTTLSEASPESVAQLAMDDVRKRLEDFEGILDAVEERIWKGRTR